MTTKERILNTGLQLFNQEGVEIITTRHIAKEIGMSQGNLHYHFPNKNEVILALLHQFFEELKSAQRFEGGLFDRQEIFLSMQENYRIMFTYRFFFVEDKVVWRRLPEVKTQLLRFFETTRTRIQQVIDGYVGHQLFRAEVSTDQQAYLLDQFMFSITSWLHAVDYMRFKGDPSVHFAKYTFSIWLPYLEHNEAREWEDLLVRFNK